MISRLRNFIDDRTGLGKFIDLMLLEHIPGGAKWRYTWGTALAFVFTVQLVTGVLLMTAYSPSDSQAWSSVYFIQYEMDFGWLIRGLHHFGSQTMVVLMAVHMLQVVIAGAHLKPREINWWLGLGLMGAILGLGLTGYLLPWDQKGYYATQVATNIAGNMPVVGPFVQKVIVGGPEYGSHTLTRFFALHVAILPGAVIVLLIAHVAVFRRHGVTTPGNATSEGWFWPDQAFKDMVVSMLIFAAMVGLVVWGWGNKVPTAPMAERSTYDKIAHAGKDGRGAHLDAPADPDAPYPARPEWYFLALFQLLKYFEGPRFLVGTLYIPMGVGALLFVLPLLGYGSFRKVGHAFGVLVVVALVLSVGGLTAQALLEDTPPSKLDQAPWKQLMKANEVAGIKGYDKDKADAFAKQLEHADERAKRAVELAAAGSPAIGGRDPLRNDPMTRGKDLFAVNCASCHAYTDPHDGPLSASPTASDLTDFASEKWIERLLTDPGHDAFFGKTGRTTMSDWAKENFQLNLSKEDLDALSAEDKKALPAAQEKAKAEIAVLAKWLASQPTKTSEDRDEEWFKKGQELFGRQGRKCIECHAYEGEGGGKASRGPDLTGYGSADWVREMVMLPYGKGRYGVENAMPAFRDLDGPAANVTRQEVATIRDAALAKVDAKAPRAKEQRDAIEAAHRVINLSDLDRELIVRFLTRDGRVVFGGEPISGPPPK